MIDRRPGAGTFIRRQTDNLIEKLGLLVPRITIMPEEYGEFVSLFSLVLSQMSRAAIQNNYIIMMNDLPMGDEKQSVSHALRISEQLIDMRVKGVFFMPLELHDRANPANHNIAGAFDRAGINVVLLDRDLVFPPARGPYEIVGLDNRQAGFDNEPFGPYLPVPLTTMRQPAEAIGSEAVRMMISRIEYPQMPPRRLELSASLVVRASCGTKPRAKRK